jgi:hypothetical protein
VAGIAMPIRIRKGTIVHTISTVVFLVKLLRFVAGRFADA